MSAFGPGRARRSVFENGYPEIPIIPKLDLLNNRHSFCCSDVNTAHFFACFFAYEPSFSFFCSFAFLFEVALGFF